MLINWQTEVGPKVIIGHPKRQGSKYSIQIEMNLPIANYNVAFPDREQPRATVHITRNQSMVFTSSPRYDRRRQQSPMLFLHAPAL